MSVALVCLESWKRISGRLRGGAYLSSRPAKESTGARRWGRLSTGCSLPPLLLLLREALEVQAAAGESSRAARVDAEDAICKGFPLIVLS